ncbi:MAG: ABC transporter ATP-binding protein, partial [Pseudomonadota bacterium]
LTLHSGQVSALVGESGSGKTLLAKALLGLLPQAATIVGGSARILGRDLSTLTSEQHRQLRGNGLGIVLQEPLTSLNPALTVEMQLTEALIKMRGTTRQRAREDALRMLDRVGIENAGKRLQEYPHQFSGGMRQRIMIAAVALLKPKLLIADEPTTAVDAQAQRAVMDLMVELVREMDAGLLLITHDLSVVADYADQIHVMQNGQIVEHGPCKKTLARPRHAYTLKLLESLPKAFSQEKPDRDYEPQLGAPVAAMPPAIPLLGVRNVSVRYPVRTSFPWRARRSCTALHPMSLELAEGEVLAVVGESGSGKTTLGRAIMGLIEWEGGEIFFQGESLALRRGRRQNTFASRIQMVFQDPYSSLNPRWTIAEIVAEPLRGLGLAREEKTSRISSVLLACGLDVEYLDRYPHELSGGQRQRAGIARALVVEPKLVIADEPVSALDLTVQSRILELLRTLQRERNFSMIFISHDLAVVQAVADRIVVMREGRIVEQGSVCQVFESATHPYTQSLLDASPQLFQGSDGAYRLAPRQYEGLPLPEGVCAAPQARKRVANQLEKLNLDPGHSILVVPSQMVKGSAGL